MRAQDETEGKKIRRVRPWMTVQVTFMRIGQDCPCHYGSEATSRGECYHCPHTEAKRNTEKASMYTKSHSLELNSIGKRGKNQPLVPKLSAEGPVSLAYS